MAKPSFSLIIPVFNRPQELQELLNSLLRQDYEDDFEVVVVEDGSTLTSMDVVAEFSERLQIAYFEKPNTGPGDSRNYGMQRAKGDYFIILDSDCILPPHYLSEVAYGLAEKFVHCFGGPDAAHESFTALQKAIDFSMTSFMTTGGIRGGKKSVGKFQPRSFNMGLSKEVFELTGGFGNIHPGEDPDLTFRIWKAGFESQLFSEAFVYHKRRIDWGKFYSQMKKFGTVRPILNKWHPKTRKITYWFPTLFIMGLLFAVLSAVFWGIWPLGVYGCYFLLVFVLSTYQTRSVKVGLLSVVAACIQFTAYGIGFLKSTILVNFSHKPVEQIFPKLFFSKH